MPRCWSSAPRKKLPPPVTTAIWTPALETAAISRAMACATSGSTPTLPPPKTAPESFSRTRLYDVTRDPFVRRCLSRSLSRPYSSAADLETRETGQRHTGLVEHRLDRLLVLGD